MNTQIKKVLAPLASLRVTVVLLAMSMVLVFAGTWAQKSAGIWDVQRKFFHSFWAWVDWQTFAPEGRHVPGGFPILGGYSLIALLLANLLAAHSVRFKLSWKRSGILLIHFGLILLLVGELVTSLMAVESQITMREGDAFNYAQDIREVELAVTDPSPADHDHAVVISKSRLKTGTLVHDPKLPFDVHVDAYYVNASLPKRSPADTDSLAASVTAGEGLTWKVAAKPAATGVGEDADKVDLPAGYVTLTAGGQKVGTYLISAVLDPQDVEVNGKRYQLQLRFRRYYKPYTVRLMKFSWDKYVGTDVARNFASEIQLTDPSRGVDRRIRIWMNHPLRYHGETFYQQGADVEKGTQRKFSTLQIVTNPGWLMPYFACAIGALGLIIHFGMHLIGFLRRRAKETAKIPTPLPMPAKAGKRGSAGRADDVGDSYTLQPTRGVASAGFLLPAAVAAVCVVYLIARAGAPSKPSADIDLDSFGQIPINYNGRPMPLDSVARTALKKFSGRETAELGDKTVPAIQWLADVLGFTDRATQYHIFRIDHPEVVSALRLDPKRKYFSLDEIMADPDRAQREMAQAMSVKQRGPFEVKMLELGQNVEAYDQLAHLTGLYAVPPLKAGEEWRTLGDATEEAQSGGDVHPGYRGFVAIIRALNQKQPGDFNAAVTNYRALLDRKMPAVTGKVGFEAFLNRFDPFLLCIIFYLVAFVFAACSWLVWRVPLGRTAFVLLEITFLVHTFGLLSRIYISGRPPVTNLYSSAIFISWAGVRLALILEAIYRNGIGGVAAAVMGFVSLVISVCIQEGDTMHPLVAVLDTNFWLWTHVPCVTLGYASTFLAGVLGIVYLVIGLFTKRLDEEVSKTLARMVYGVVCFAMLFSFVGTILGGIWADQSWGRFWGWDPKENGAVLIVLWNALILHARWGGLVRTRGMMLLAVFGNIVTSWSWFGTNMLGIGLHSYGFMDKAFITLIMVVAGHLALIALGNLPLRRWRSFASSET